MFMTQKKKSQKSQDQKKNKNHLLCTYEQLNGHLSKKKEKTCYNISPFFKMSK